MSFLVVICLKFLVISKHFLKLNRISEQSEIDIHAFSSCASLNNVLYEKSFIRLVLRAKRGHASLMDEHFRCLKL